MKKSFKLENLQCAHCASKMEVQLNKSPLIESASINFLTSRLTITAPDMDAAIDFAQPAISKIERNCRIVV